MVPIIFLSEAWVSQSEGNKKQKKKNQGFWGMEGGSKNVL